MRTPPPADPHRPQETAMTLAPARSLGTPGINRFTRSPAAAHGPPLRHTDPDLAHPPSTSGATVALGGSGVWTPRAHRKIWLLTWPPGTSTGRHDHDGSSGRVRHRSRGALTRDSAGPTRGRPQPGACRRRGPGSFGRHHIHQVGNLGPHPALSVHVYSPALTRMNRYAVVDGGLQHTGAGEQVRTGEHHRPLEDPALQRGRRSPVRVGVCTGSPRRPQLGRARSSPGSRTSWPTPGPDWPG